MFKNELKFLCVLLILHRVVGRCDLLDEARPATNDISFNLADDPESYLPRTKYTVVLKSRHEFKEFIITTDRNTWSGNFQLFNDGITKFSDDCSNTVQNGDYIAPVKVVNIVWVSPLKGCHSLIGAIKKHNNKWEFANKTICDMEHYGSKNTFKCCACDHAKYRLIFKGIWSPNTFPRDFPKPLEFTHFSDLIGATHSSNYTMWKEGKYSSSGFKQLAEFGVTSEMEDELRQSAKNLKTIIKATGLWHPNLNGNMTGTFKVDPRHHLVSLASMFGPSPDWIVGVSSLNLCEEDCSWMDNVEIDLHPYDAGTDNGISYNSLKQPSDPPERISKITSIYPDDRRSPFHDPNGNENPVLAKLFITREKLIPKKCTDRTENELLEEVSESDNTEDEHRVECNVGNYSLWSPCAVTCGKGLRMRKRDYSNPALAQIANCKRQLVFKEMCIGSQEKCPGEEDEDEGGTVLSSECEVTVWSEWSDCSVTCGIGSKVRRRQFKKEESLQQKKCGGISRTEASKCMLPPCFANEKKNLRECSVTEWTQWSPCPVTCGHGTIVRVRSFLKQPPPSQCSSTKLEETIPCVAANDCSAKKNEPREVCNQPIIRGPCRAAFERWAYDNKTKDCITFVYSGCKMNRNNFETLQECSDTCVDYEKIDEQRPEQKERMNCVVSPWSSWSPCKPCKNGTRTKKRKIIIKPANGGKHCPKLTRSVKCNVPEEFCTFTESDSNNEA